MMNRNNKYEYLPIGLAKKLEDLFTSSREYRTNNNLLIIVGTVCYKLFDNDTLSYYSYYPLSVAYWKKVIGSHYSKYLTILLSNDIIQCDWVNYVSDLGEYSRVKGYRINPSLLSEKFSLINYLVNKTDSITVNESIDMYEDNQKVIRTGFKPQLITMQKLQAISWLKNGLPDVINGYINLNYADGLPKKMSVSVRLLNNNGSFVTYYMSIEAAQKLANEQGKKLIYYKDKFIITTEDILTAIAIQNLTLNYKWQIKSFLPENFNFARNEKTLRVYSKLSSLPSALLQFVRINGEYIMQADLKCSQFTLLGNLVNYYINHSGKELISKFKKKPAKTFVLNLVNIFNIHKDEFPNEGLIFKNPWEDQYDANNLYKFIVDSLLHDFYGIITNELGLPQRQHGKLIAFRTVFAKPKPENELVKQLRTIYPSIINIINDFKNKYGYNQFAIGLQQVEAEIFIDHIWKKVKNAGINSFTRHDSILFPINMKNEIEQIITDVFADFDFLYKIEYEEFNTDEIERRLINETDFMDTIDDFDEILFYSMGEAEKKAKTEKIVEYLYEEVQDIELPKMIKDDYFEDVSLDTLETIAELEYLSSTLKDALEEDIANLRSTYSIQRFQDKTNKFITQLIELKGE
jgi:hypothetical protein